ncbi:MAG: type I glyceraldehyde-3-phosphate dehydrogenase [Cyclobacteriaceae bacterium]
MDIRQNVKTSSRLAINGMGRIGRTLFRLLRQKNALHNLVAVNDVMPKENLIYLLKYDSMRGSLSSEVTSTSKGISVDGHEIYYYQQSDINQLPWRELTIDTVVEATGLFTHSSEAALHISNGAKRVLLSTYSKDIPSTIWGVNHQDVNKETKIISPGDCTINCVAPLINMVQKNWGVHSLHINVIQGYTTRQELLDAPYKGFRRGRAAGHSIIPFEVNIKPVLETIFPALQGKIESISTRVPIPCGALADVSFFLHKPTDTKTVNSIFEKEAAAELKNIMNITFDPIVSADILGNPHSSVIDGSLTKVTNGNHLKLMAWFDNEWGYANRLMDWVNSL